MEHEQDQILEEEALAAQQYAEESLNSLDNDEDVVEMPDASINDLFANAKDKPEQMELFNNANGISSTTQDAETARRLNIDGINMEEEEEIIKNHLEPDRYLDASKVASIHNQYERSVANVTNEYKKAIAEAEKNEDFEKAKQLDEEFREKLKGYKADRDKKIVDLCEDAPHYNKLFFKTKNSIMKKQLKGADVGRPMGEMKIYRVSKDENGEKSLNVTTYSENRVGEFNKMMRDHEQKVLRMKDQRGHRHKDKLGYSTKDFMQGDAEHMFKGSVAMGFHAALILLNKLAKLGNMTAHHILFKYAMHRLTMDDAAALQKAVDDVSKDKSMGQKEAQTNVNEGPEFIVGGPLAIVGNEANALTIAEGTNTPNIAVDFTQYVPKYDVLRVHFTYQNENGEQKEGDVFLGDEENIRKCFKAYGKEDGEIDEAIARNRAAVKAMGLEKYMVKDAYTSFYGEEPIMPERPALSVEQPALSGPVAEGAEDVMDIMEESKGSGKRADIIEGDDIHSLLKENDYGDDMVTTTHNDPQPKIEDREKDDDVIDLDEDSYKEV